MATMREQMAEKAKQQAQEMGELLRYQRVTLEELRPNPKNPRKQFDTEEDQLLAEDVKRNGILVPLLVRKLATGVLEIIAGERRFRAAKAAELKQVPVLVTPADDAQALLISIKENSHRRDLSWPELADSIVALREGQETSQVDIAASLGKSKQLVSQLLACAPLLTEKVREAVATHDFRDYSSLAALGPSRLNEEAALLLIENHTLLPARFRRSALPAAQNPEEVIESIMAELGKEPKAATAPTRSSKKAYDRKAIGRYNFLGGDFKVSYSPEGFSFVIAEKDPKHRRDAIRRAMDLLQEADKKSPEKWRSFLAEIRNKERAEAAAKTKADKKKPRA